MYVPQPPDLGKSSFQPPGPYPWSGRKRLWRAGGQFQCPRQPAGPYFCSPLNFTLALSIARLSLLLLLGLWLPPLAAQPDSSWEQLAGVEGLISAAETDSALLLVDHLRATVPEGNDWSDAFRRRLDLTRVKALIRARMDPEATTALVRLIDNAQNAQDYSVLADATLRLAFIYQRQRLPGAALDHLHRADTIIEAHGLTSLHPLLYNRLAGYYRVFGRREQVIPYAERALSAAVEQGDTHQEALAHVNLSVAYREMAPERSEYHTLEAARYYRHTGSIRDYFAMALMLAGQKSEAGDWQAALAASDTSMLYVNRVVAEDQTYLHRVYELRARIMQELGHIDSAFHYLNLAHDAEVQLVSQLSAQNVAAIEASYESEKQQSQIAEQEKTITYQRGRQWRVITIFVLIIVLLVLLYFYTDKARRGRAATERQRIIEDRNSQLSESLAQQKMLQGEIHHRVKNNLQIIVSLLQMQMKKVEDVYVRANLEAMAGRIFSMAAVHEILYQEGSSSEVDFKLYAEKICHHFEFLSHLSRECDFDLNMEGFWFNLETAIPLGTMFNELLTNSFKYASLPDRPLRISVCLTEAGEELLLEYRDNGPGWSADALAGKGSGLGTYLLRGMSRQLRGRVEMLNQDGAVTRIWFRRKNEHKSNRFKKHESRTLAPSFSS